MVGVCFYGRREGEKERRGDGKDTGVLMLMCWDNPFQLRAPRSLIF